MKEEILGKMAGAVLLAEESLEEVMLAHNWKIRRQNNDKVLDAASKCFKNNSKIREIFKKTKRFRNERRLVAELTKFDKEYAWVNKDFEGLAGVIESF